MTPIVQGSAIAVVTLGLGAATMGTVDHDIPDLPVPEMAWEAGSALDGMVFEITAELDNGSEMQTDVLRFEDGAFLSDDCEVYCNFGFTPYQTYVDGNVIHFTTAPVCSEAPHNTVWYGTVQDGRIEVAMTWTTRRWYWTHQIAGVGEGTLMPVETALIAQ